MLRNAAEVAAGFASCFGALSTYRDAKKILFIRWGPQLDVPVLTISRGANEPC